MGEAKQAQSVTDADTQRAAEILVRGGVVAFPTETVYGLGADASNPDAVRRVFALKGRPATNPVIVHVADVEGARRCVREWPAEAQTLAERFWPGPLTIVLPKADAIAPEVTAGGETVGVRVPDHPIAMEMLKEFARIGGMGVAAPSANRSSRVSPTTAQHVRDDLGEPGGGPDKPDMILDGGPCRVGIESTVISLATLVPTVLRPGGVSLEALREVLGEVATRGGVDLGPARSPGRQQRHYSPRARLVVVERGSARVTPTQGMLILDRAGMTFDGRDIAMPEEPQEYARRFYAALRELDAMGVNEILVELPPDEPRWQALRDRIMRAES